MGVPCSSMLAFCYACFTPACQNGLFMCTEKGAHEDQPPVLGHFALQGSLLWDPIQHIPKQPEIFPEFQTCDSPFPIAHFFQDAELQNIMFAAT